MVGKRVPDVTFENGWHDRLRPGEYRLTHNFPTNTGRKSVWECRPPGDLAESLQGNLAAHDITEHEDGTITVSPSILIKTTWAGEPVEWHGYLEKGVWREV